MTENAVGNGENIAGTGSAPNEYAPLLFKNLKIRIVGRLKKNASKQQTVK